MATRPGRAPVSGSLKYWNIMVYADPGAGKTVFAGQDNKVLFLAPESDGLMSAATMNSTAEHIEDVTQWEDVKNAYEWYDEHRDELNDVNVLAIDSISEMQSMCKNYVLRMTADEKRRKNQDPTRLQIQDYGIMHELLEGMVRGFNDLPVNVLWTATAKTVEDADKKSFIAPDLQGKKDYGVAMKMAALMSAYGYLRVEIHEVPAPTETDPKAIKVVKRRVIYWEDTGTIRGKDRTNKLKPFTINMTLQQMRLAIASKMRRDGDGKIVKLDAPVKAEVTPVLPKPPEPEKKDDELSDNSGDNPVESKPEPDKPAESAPGPTVVETETKEDLTPELDAVDA